MSVNGTHTRCAPVQEKDMTSLKIFGVALVLSAFVAAPASAWEAVSEPGAYSFYHPNADVLNVGPSPDSSNAMASMMRSDAMASTHMSMRLRRGNSTAGIKRY
jgi:hypothetical protein